MPLAKDAKPVNIYVAERKKFAMSLRAAGLSYREVADEAIKRFGGGEHFPSTYDERYAHRDVKYEMERLRTETLESALDYRILEMERLDSLQTAVWPAALNGDYKAIDRILKIMHHRALLLGLYAPQQSKVQVHDWHTEIIDLIKSGRITRAQAEEELGEELVSQLLDTGSEAVVEGSFAETEN